MNINSKPYRVDAWFDKKTPMMPHPIHSQLNNDPIYNASPNPQQITQQPYPILFHLIHRKLHNNPTYNASPYPQ